MIQRAQPETIDLDSEKMASLLRRVEDNALVKEDFETIRAVFESYVYVTQLIDKTSTTIARLRKLLFGARTEKTAAVLGRANETAAVDGEGQPDGKPDPAVQAAATAGPEAPAPAKPGHGRNSADDYPGARRIRITHASLQPGDPCPECQLGTAYAVASPGVLIRFLGQPPVQATIYELQKLRCNLCSQIFTAQPPAGVGAEKYDATVASMIGLLKYGAGMPFYRLAGLQENVEVPLPVSTQWDVVHAATPQLQPAFEELIRQAAQGDVLHNDDTGVKILEMMGLRAQQAVFTESDNEANREPGAPERKGLFTSGVVATHAGRRIALFFSGNKHAGENLGEVLRHRAAELPPPIQMCDALSRNRPEELQTIMANCLAHGRRQFVDVSEHFPAECRFVLESIEVIYHNDALARERQLTAAERLSFHQAESGPSIERLREWLKRQLEEKLVERNSGLGAAISYLTRHWEKLTLFLRQPGAPLDNNICERALKKAILHRKNALFYKTRHGASVGDLYMSLIYTCELCAANPYDYLTKLQRNAAAVAAAPQDWLPWNYRDNLTPV